METNETLDAPAEENTTPQTVQTVQINSKGTYVEVARRKVNGVDEWHWCLWSANGRRMAVNAEPYNDKKAAIVAIRAMHKAVGELKNIVQSHQK